MNEISTKKAIRELKKGKTGIYLYAVIPFTGGFKVNQIKGFDGNKIKLLHFKKISAVVSKAELKEYEPNFKEVTIHKKIGQHFLKNGDVLPVAYGMVFKTNKILMRSIRKLYPKMVLYLRKVRGKVELGLKVLAPQGRRGYSKRSRKLKKKCEKEFSKLTRISEAAKGLKLFSEKLTFNASFLVKRDRVNEFSKKVEEIADRLGVRASYSGPWPPYNFITLRLRKK